MAKLGRPIAWIVNSQEIKALKVIDNNIIIYEDGGELSGHSESEKLFLFQEGILEN